FAYHWRLFFAHERGTSVELQTALMSVQYRSAITLALSRPYLVTNRGVQTALQLRCARKWTVQQLIDYVVGGKQRHKFRFDIANGSGCAFWCLTVIWDLEETGMFERGTTAAAQKHRDDLRINDPRSLPVQMPRGFFYARTRKEAHVRPPPPAGKCLTKLVAAI
ncbi:uncharacterized protein C8Q71DRAFT_710545, partial [Rhodofomes roseus]